MVPVSQVYTHATIDQLVHFKLTQYSVKYISIKPQNAIKSQGKTHLDEGKDGKKKHLSCLR